MANASVIVKNADRMMTSATPVESGIELVFADGCTGLIPFTDLPEIGTRAGLAELEIPNPFELLLTNSRGETSNVPWDFARHYCDPAYQPRIETAAARGREAWGIKIKRLRRAARLTQEQLAASAGIGRVTLVRLETGGQSPRLETLYALARALGMNFEELATSAAAPGP